MILFRGFSNNQWFYGSYLKHQQTQPCIGFSDQDYQNNIQSIIIFDGFADWNMPKPIKCVEVNDMSVGISYDDFDNSNKRIYSDDIITFNDSVGLVISLKKGLFVIDLKNNCYMLSDVLENNIVNIVNNIFELKEPNSNEKKLIELKKNYNTIL